MENKNHEYGLDLYEDLEQLYGENYEEINNKRYSLFTSLKNEIDEIKRLRNIIQNPVPIPKLQFKEWAKIKNETLKEYQYDISLRTIHTLRSIEDFVYDYHIIEED